jgi:hypothetical protein
LLKHPAGAKARRLLSICGTTKQAAEKGLVLIENREKHASGAKALLILLAFVPGINPRPTGRMSFSAACKVVPFQNLTFTTGY